MNAFVKLVRSEFRLLVREPLAVFFALMFPSLLVVILGSVPAFRKPRGRSCSARYGPPPAARRCSPRRSPPA